MALTNREIFYAILEQGLDYLLYDKKIFDNAFKFEQSQRGNRDKIAGYFMNIRDEIKLEELRFH
jgi:hypothetical protein